MGRQKGLGCKEPTGAPHFLEAKLLCYSKFCVCVIQRSVVFCLTLPEASMGHPQHDRGVLKGQSQGGGGKRAS